MRFSASLLMVALAALQVQAQEPVKYAPRYCLRWKVNCEKQAGHVCCRFPLPPEDGSGVDEDGNVPRVNSLTSNPRVNFRPIVLPSARKPQEPQQDQQQQVEKVEQSADQGDKADGGDHDSGNPMMKKRKPLIGMRRNPSFMSKPNNDQGSGLSPASRPLVGSKVSPFSMKNKKKPRLCLRLVVNCATQPDHRCCQFEDTPETTEAPAVSEEEMIKEPVGEEEVHETEAPLADQVLEVIPFEPLQTSPPSTPAPTPVPEPQPSTPGRPSRPLRPLRPAVRPTRPPTPLPIVVASSTTDTPATEVITTSPTSTTTATASTTTTDTPPSSPATSLPVTEGWIASVETVPYVPVTSQDQEVYEEPLPAVAKLPLEPLLEAPSVAVVHQKIPAECFSQTYDCSATPGYMCCQYM